MNPLLLALLSGLIKDLAPVIINRWLQMHDQPPADDATLEQFKALLHDEVAKGLSEIDDARRNQKQ